MYIGAVARITCQAVDEHGYNTVPFSILSCATDNKGYFFATLSPSELQISGSLKIARNFSIALHWKLAKLQLTSIMALAVLSLFLIAS
jgi:hypothetical protein